MITKEHFRLLHIDFDIVCSSDTHKNTNTKGDID